MSGAGTDGWGTDGWGACGHVCLGLFCVALLVAGLAGWGATATLDGAVVAPGQVRVESRRQVVQHPDGGVVAAILAREGDRVAAGQVLIRLDGTALRAELATLESQLYELMARRGRLEAEQTGRDHIAFDPELIEAGRTRPEVASLIAGQRALFAARRETMEREIEAQRGRQAQIRDEIAGAEAERAASARQRALIAEELESQRRLLEKGLAQASRVLGLEREAARLEGEDGRLAALIARLDGRLAEIEVAILRLHAARREQAIAELRDIGYRELELAERRIALTDRLARLELRAPVSGVVYGMTMHALGAVIRPAEPVLYLVPTNGRLVIEAEIAPADIDSVHAGQQATLRFPAFSARTTPALSGRVTLVSADAFADPETRRSFYRAEVALAEGEAARLGARHLVAGMPAEVFIRTGARTPLAYLAKPVTDYFARALREE